MLAHALLGGAILVSYVVVIGNVFGDFATERYVGYFHNEWWVGLPEETAVTLTILQILEVLIEAYESGNLNKDVLRDGGTGYSGELTNLSKKWNSNNVTVLVIPSN